MTSPNINLFLTLVQLKKIIFETFMYLLIALKTLLDQFIALNLLKNEIVQFA